MEVASNDPSPQGIHENQDRQPTGNEPPLAQQREPRRFPPLWLWIFVAVCAATIYLIRLPDTPDQGIANIVTLIAGFFAMMSLLVWLAFFSAYPKVARMTPLVAIVGGALLGIALFRVDGTWGALNPKFQFRWAPKPDQTLERPVAPATDAAVDLATTTPEDFPQFLGPDRNAVLEGVEMERDWKAAPPRLVWRQRIGAGWSAFSVVNGFAVTMEQRDQDEMVTCYEVATGKLRWWQAIEDRHETIPGGVGPRSTPTIHEGKVYALGATGVLRCLDGATGSVVWTKDVLQEYGMTAADDQDSVTWGRAASPLIVGRLVVVPAGGPADGPKVSLVAFDKDTGEKVWEGGDRQISYSSPTLVTMAGMQQIAIVNEDTVSGHDPQTGQLLWQQEWSGSSSGDANTSQAVGLSGDRILVSKGYGTGAAVFHVSRNEDGTWSVDPEPVWQNKSVLKTKLTNVAIRDGFAYALSDGILECADLETGERMWKQGRYGHGQVLRVGGVLLIQAESGELLLVEATPEEHRELARIEGLGDRTWNNPALYGRYLLVRNDQEAACYELPLAEKK